MHRNSGILVLGILANACSSSDAPSAGEEPAKALVIVADLRADSNRDGQVAFDESDAQKTTWDARSGAVFLANIDDDRARCSPEGEDVDLAKCNDASNDVDDGADDALDLARLK